jgi:signal transduction histidine kinase
VSDQASVLAARAPGQPDEALLAAAAAKEFGDGGRLRRESGQDVPTQLVATVTGRVVASFGPHAVAVGAGLPAEALGITARDGELAAQEYTAHWATKPVAVADPDGSGARLIGIAYALVEMPAGRKDPKDREKASGTGIGSLILPGAVVLVLLLPVGALFGLFSTGRLIRRIRRLALGASAMAGGDLQARIPVSGDDEVGRLERAFNSIAERLDAAVALERRAAGSEARRAERSRIARELHDSISQDLFSVSMVAGGLRKALPTQPELQRQAESMERSLARTMREMRAMLLELRPIALEDAGLAAALDELCRAYEARLGIRVSARLDPVRLDPPVEHAVLRVVQEAFGNAARHGDPATIELRVAEQDGQVAVTIHDDGRGFDPAGRAVRHGMGLMLISERVDELGGTYELVSAPGRGTTLTVLLPMRAAAGAPAGTP